MRIAALRGLVASLVLAAPLIGSPAQAQSPDPGVSLSVDLIKVQQHRNARINLTWTGAQGPATGSIQIVVEYPAQFLNAGIGGSTGGAGGWKMRLLASGKWQLTLSLSKSAGDLVSGQIFSWYQLNGTLMNNPQGPVQVCATLVRGDVNKLPLTPSPKVCVDVNQ